MIQTINHFTLAVAEVKRSFDFYRQVLGFKPLVLWDGGAYFLVGDFWFCLDRERNPIINNDSTHIAFSVNSADFLSMSQDIIDSGAIIFKQNTSPGKSLYFLDPDGHKLEIHTGDWQQRVAARKLDEGKWQDVKWFI